MTKKITVELTIEELRLLAALASDQLFRREFIDPKMPGHRANSGEIAAGKELISRLKALTSSGPVRPTNAPPARRPEPTRQGRN